MSFLKGQLQGSPHGGGHSLRELRKLREVLLPRKVPNVAHRLEVREVLARGDVQSGTPCCCGLFTCAAPLTMNMIM